MLQRNLTLCWIIGCMMILGCITAHSEVSFGSASQQGGIAPGENQILDLDRLSSSTLPTHRDRGAATAGLLPDTVEFIHQSTNLWSGFTSSAISGDYAYVTLLPGLWVYDISTPSAPVHVAELYLGGGRDIAVSGDYAFVVTTNFGIKVVDVSNPLSPRLAGNYTGVWGDCATIAMAGDYAYVGFSAGAVDVVDISNPLAPSVCNDLPHERHRNHERYRCLWRLHLHRRLLVFRNRRRFRPSLTDHAERV